MKYISFSTLITFLFLSLGLASCQVVGDILEAGIWTAVIGVVLIVLLVIWLFKKIF